MKMIRRINLWCGKLKIWWVASTPFEKIVRIFALAIVMQAFAIIILFDIARDNNRIGKDTNALVSYINEQTSPERQQRTSQTIDQIIIRIDCAGAVRDQRLIDGLVQQRLIDPIDVVNGCKKQGE